MLSFAIVSLSPCSAAISSRTGATILQGPHHSAQKSTSTGLSLPSTSLAKLVSVTVTVLPAMGRSPSRGLTEVPGGRTHRGMDLFQGCPARAGSAAPRLPLVEGLGQPALSVYRRGGTGAGRRDGLAVDVVDDVPAGEHPVDIGAG